MQQETKRVYRYGFGLLALAAGFLLLVLLLYPYPKLEALFGQFNAEKETLYPWNDFEGSYGFSRNTYWLALSAYFLIFVVSLFSYFRLRKDSANSFLNSVKSIIGFFWNKLLSVWQQTPFWEKVIVSISGILLVLVRVYFLVNSRIGQDEAASFIFFISKGLAGIMFYYPLPNNHIFYNLLCLPFSYIFADPFWALELPTFILSIAGSAIIYLAYRSVLPFLVVFFAAAIFYFSQYALYFSVHGRGYFLMSICAALVGLAAFKIYERKENLYWLVFLVCSVIGFYTIPIFLYPFVTVFIFSALAFGFKKDWPALRNLVLISIFVGLITALLYTPVIMGSKELLFSNRYVQARPFDAFYQGFPFFFTYTQGSVIGQETYGFYFWLLGFLGISGLLLLNFRWPVLLKNAALKPAFLFLIWINMLLPWIFIFIQRVRPPERVLFYKGFFDLLAIGVVLYVFGFFVFRKWPKLLIAGFLLFIAGYSAYQIHKTRRNEEIEIMAGDFDTRLQTILRSGAKVIYANEIYYSGNLRYEFFKHGKYDLILSEFHFNPIHKYEVLILDQSGPAPEALSLADYQLFYQDKFVRIFFLKSFLESPESNVKINSQSNGMESL